MPTRDTPWPTGTPCWIDLTIADFDEAAKFYSTLFGWHVEPGAPEFGGYAVCTKDGRDVAGLGPRMDENQPLPGWITYLATDSLDATIAKIGEAGGTVPMEPMDVGDAGRMTLAMDPAGAGFGLWQANKMVGSAIFNEAGTLVWTENFSSDWERNKAFYGAVFGYSFGDMSSDEFKYATLDFDGRPCGGIGQIPGQPAQWKVYFGVADTDAAVSQVQELGGTLVDPPADTPYGRMAGVKDSQGHAFSLMSIRAA
ncbi:MAG TPA: VOC family protein [Pseudonocardiaceae bacterium]|jgi:hypothetical protein|nr:VOC family protein [Pseudonocardiaceae bacterium]